MTVLELRAVERTHRSGETVVHALRGVDLTVAAERQGGAAFADEGPDYPGGALLAVLAVIAGLVTLAGVAISVALSAAEGRADLATLAAVGAEPRRRRVLSAAQALLVAGLGCAAGVAVGTFVAVVSQPTTGAPDLVVPWANLAVTGLAVPLVAVAVAAAVTPSRLPLVRRLAWARSARAARPPMWQGAAHGDRGPPRPRRHHGAERARGGPLRGPRDR